MLTARQAVSERHSRPLLGKRSLRMHVIPRPDASKSRAVRAPKASLNIRIGTGWVDLVRQRDHVSARSPSPTVDTLSAEAGLVVPEDAVNAILSFDRHVAEPPVAPPVHAHSFSRCTSVEGHEHLGTRTRIDVSQTEQRGDSRFRAHPRCVQKSFVQAKRVKHAFRRDAEPIPATASVPRTAQRHRVLQTITGHISGQAPGAASPRGRVLSGGRGGSQQKSAEDRCRCESQG